MIRNRSAERPSAGWTRAGWLALVGALALTTASCAQFSTDGLLLRNDTTIEITRPKDRRTVTVPLRVSWADSAPREGGGYAVIIDRTPMPVGETVAWFARGDETCVASQGCPDERWLAIRGVTVTNELSVDIAIVSPRGESRADGFYEITVVRLDPQGRRDGEAAFGVQVRVDR